MRANFLVEHCQTVLEQAWVWNLVTKVAQTEELGKLQSLLVEELCQVGPPSVADEQRCRALVLCPLSFLAVEPPWMMQALALNLLDVKEYAKSEKINFSKQRI